MDYVIEEGFVIKPTELIPMNKLGELLKSFSDCVTLINGYYYLFLKNTRTIFRDNLLNLIIKDKLGNEISPFMGIKLLKKYDHYNPTPRECELFEAMYRFDIDFEIFWARYAIVN